MPKLILKQPNAQSKSAAFLSTAQNSTQSSVQRQQIQHTDKMKTDKILRKTRSKKYIDAMSKLDAGGHVHNQSKVNEIIDAIRSEFPEVEINGILLGVVSKCYLGNPYEVHTLDMTDEIVEHYKCGQVLPCGMEKARSIALSDRYEFIEVYVDCCRAISPNGTVAVIAC